MMKESPKYKKGDIVKIDGFKSPGIIVGHEGNCYHIELSSPYLLKFIDHGNMVFYLEPVTYIKRVCAHIGLIRYADK